MAERHTAQRPGDGPKGIDDLHTPGVQEFFYIGVLAFLLQGHGFCGFGLRVFYIGVPGVFILDSLL